MISIIIIRKESLSKNEVDEGKIGRESELLPPSTQH